MKVTVSVTADDIAKGEPGEPCNCPVARAAQRVFGDESGIWVLPDELEFESPKVRLRLPREVQDWISRFDGALPVEPFEFEVDVPDELAVTS